MGEALLMSCMIELGAIVAKEGIKQYLNHRRQIIEEHREDTLLINPNKIKYISNYIEKMSSRNNTPIKQRLKDDVIKIVGPDTEKILEDDIIPVLRRCENIVRNETITLIGQENEKIIENDIIPIIQPIGEEIISKLEDIYEDNDKSDEEAETKDTLTEKLINDFTIRNSLEKQRKSLINFSPMKIKETINNITRSITPTRNKIIKPALIHDEFEGFIKDICKFISSELKCQDMDNAHLQTHKDYTKKLIFSLTNQNNHEPKRNLKNKVI